MENRVSKKKKEAEKCLDDFLDSEIMESVFPRISTFKTVVKEEARGIIEQYLRVEKSSRLTPPTIAGASIYLAISNLYNQGKLPKKIAQADAANLSGRSERTIRLAAKRIKERKRYEEYTRLEKKVLELLRQGKISDVKAGAIFEILESAYKLDEPLPDPENLAQKKEEELIKITHKYWRIIYWEKKIEKIRPPIF